MPVYCFTSDGGETVEEIFRMGEAPDYIAKTSEGKNVEVGLYEIIPEGVELYLRDRTAEWKGGPRSGGKGWPIVCYASGVHAGQAQELRDHFKERGVDCDVTSDGDPIYRNHQHR